MKAIKRDSSSALQRYDVKTLKPHVIAGASGARGVQVHDMRCRAVPVPACAGDGLSQPTVSPEEGVIKRQNAEQEKQYSVIK
jgi:hypothetical protein